MNKTRNLKVVFDFISDYLTDDEPSTIKTIKTVNIDTMNWAQSSTETDDINDSNEPLEECEPNDNNFLKTGFVSKNFETISKDLEDANEDWLKSSFFGEGTTFHDILTTDEGRNRIRNMMKIMDEMDTINNIVDENIKIRDLNEEVRALTRQVDFLTHLVDGGEVEEKETGTGVTLGDDGKIISVNVDLLKPLEHDIEISEKTPSENVVDSTNRINDYLSDKYPNIANAKKNIKNNDN